MNGRSEKRQITVFGVPVGKQRPRFCKTGGGRVYTPQRTLDYERQIRAAWEKLYSEQEPSEDSYRPSYILYVEVFLPIPKGTKKTDREKMLTREILPGKKPDLDNVIKVAMDGLNGVAYVDDAQVVSIMGYKAYAENPRLVLTLQEVCCPCDTEGGDFVRG